jgi:hypothetical protein
VIPFGRPSCRYIGEISHPARFERSCSKRASAAPSSSISSEKRPAAAQASSSSSLFASLRSGVPNPSLNQP